MRAVLAATFLIFGFLLVSQTVVLAQTVNEASDFDQRAKRSFQRVDVKYLRADQKLEDRSDWLNSATPEKETSRSPVAGPTAGQRAIAFAMLAIALGLIGYFWWRNRLGGNLFSSAKDKRFRGEDDEDNELLMAAKKGEQSASALSAIGDPKEGLHALLLQALVKAANQNGINLRRSLTTRDVLQRVPTSWKYHDVLLRLARQAELVFFGGREITRADYERALELSSELLNDRTLGSAVKP